jgi:hypothetical protein
MNAERELWYLRRAEHLYEEEGRVEIAREDPCPVAVPRKADPKKGAFVKAWVWVPGPDSTTPPFPPDEEEC